MRVYGVSDTTRAVETEYVSIELPELGTMTIRYESRPYFDGKRLVLFVNFPIDKIDVVDWRGIDHQIS